MKNVLNKIGARSVAMISLALLSFSLFSVSCTEKEPEAPNVIIIFPDQFRQYSLGFWSQGENDQYIQGRPDPVITPALDKLANQSIVFSRAVSNYPLCSPYRGMLLSGMYPDRNGLTTNCRSDRDVGLDTEAECITDVFSEAGYNVAYFGKCHWEQTEPLFDESGNYIGTTEQPGGHYVNRYDTYVPPGASRHGIDYFFQALKDDHFNPRVYSSDSLAIDGKKDGELYLPGRFSAELESEKIMDYLSNTHGQRDPNKPFFMMWSLNPPHNPWTEQSTYMDYFNQYSSEGNVNLNQLLARDNADSTVGHYAPYYFANVSAVDHFIGNVLDHLESLGLADNTIIVFSSDHGEMLGSHGRTGKNVPEIEAYSIPFMVKWGDKIKHRIEDLILSVPDVMPTILGLANMSHLIPDRVQGRNYAQALLYGHEIEKPNSALFIHENSRGVFTGRYMFVVEQHKGQIQKAFYYDNEVDPYQLNAVFWEQMVPSLRQELKNQLFILLKETEDRWYLEHVCRDFFESD